MTKKHSLASVNPALLAAAMLSASAETPSTAARPMTKEERRKQERAERKARWRDVQANGTGAYEPKKWEKQGSKYPKVQPLDIPPSLVAAYMAAQRTIRGGK